MRDDYWRLASGIELRADMEADSHPSGDRLLGIVVARPHAAGWFFSVHHCPDVTPEQLGHLAEFAKVRAYLMLTQGPTPATWVRGSDGGVWIASFFADRSDVTEIVPDVPAGWW